MTEGRALIDADGWPVKAILYKPREPGTKPPFTEDMLVPFMTLKIGEDGAAVPVMEE